MTEDSPELNPTAAFLIRTREIVASGGSVYGDANSPAAKAKLEELDAKINLGQQLGEIPAEPSWDQRVRDERLKQDFPFGAPHDIPEHVVEKFSETFETLHALPAGAQSRLADAVAADFEGQASRVSVVHSRPDPATGTKPTGSAIVERLIRDAEPAVRANADDPSEVPELLRLLKLDRKALEYFAARGRNLTAYAARRKALGM